MAYPNVDCVLALFDVDNEFDGLDYEEAQLAYSFFFPYDTTEDFEAAFDGLDQNEDGLISGEELAAMGTRGREYFESHFDRDLLLDRLEGWLQEVQGANQ